MKGFIFPFEDKEVFVVTDRKNKTVSLAKEILRKMQLPDDRAKDLLYRLRKAECKINTLSNGKQYYEIFYSEISEIFGHKYSFADDSKVIIINL